MCRDGYIYDSGRCYYLSQDGNQWIGAASDCKRDNSSLFIINNQDDFDFIQEKLYRNSLFNIWV